MTTKKSLLKTTFLSGYLILVLWASSIFKVLVLAGLSMAIFISSYFGDQSLTSSSTSQAQSSYSDEWIRFFFWAFTIHLVVLVLVWFYRVYKNLHTMGIRTRYAPLWAPFSFFIWGFNFFVPYQVMQEIWVKTQRIGLSKEKARYVPHSSSLVVVWWVAWVLYSLLIVVVYVLPMLGIKPQLGFGAFVIVPIIVNNIFLLSTILDITLLALITQIRWFEKDARRRIRELKAQQNKV